MTDDPIKEAQDTIDDIRAKTGLGGIAVGGARQPPAGAFEKKDNAEPAYPDKPPPWKVDPIIPEAIPIPKGVLPTSFAISGTNIAKIISPTIVQCDQGGFLISYPGKGTAAKSSFEEAMEFLSEQVHQECYGKSRIVRAAKDFANNLPAGTGATLGVAALIFVVAAGVFAWSTGAFGGVA